MKIRQRDPISFSYFEDSILLLNHGVGMKERKRRKGKETIGNQKVEDMDTLR